MLNTLKWRQMVYNDFDSHPYFYPNKVFTHTHTTTPLVVRVLMNSSQQSVAQKSPNIDFPPTTKRTVLPEQKMATDWPRILHAIPHKLRISANYAGYYRGFSWVYVGKWLSAVLSVEGIPIKVKAVKCNQTSHYKMFTSRQITSKNIKLLIARIYQSNWPGETTEIK